MMGGMDDLVAFLRARMDEDEQAARAATPGPWEWRHENGERWQPEPGGWLDSSGEYLAAEGDVQRPATLFGPGMTPHGDAVHIARHDPARVLRQVAGIRTIVDKYAGVAPLYEREYPRVMTNARLEATHSAWESAVRSVATIWSDHPDYREEWRP